MVVGYRNTRWPHDLEVVSGGPGRLSRRQLALAAAVLNHIPHTTHEQVRFGPGVSDPWRFSR